MKKIYFIPKATIFLSIVYAMLSISACNDWTTIESVEIKQPDIAKQNPELYTEYLENLRRYKASEHKVVCTWFDNKEKTPSSRAHHIASLPDSIDIVSLMHPKLAPYEIDEIVQAKKDKAIKFIFTIDFEKIKLIYDTRLTDLKDSKNDADKEKLSQMPSFEEFLVDTINSTLPIVNAYNFDGVSIAYQGKSILHMTEKEKKEYTAYENAFIGIAKDWHERNSDKIILFEGYPQNLLNKTILERCKYIIIPCMDVGNSSKITYKMLSANVENVPDDRFIVAIETPSLDKTNKKIGYWADNKTYAMLGAAEWLGQSHKGFSAVGLGIHNVNNDYFNSDNIYKYTRQAISMINPSVKK